MSSSLNQKEELRRTVIATAIAGVHACGWLIAFACPGWSENLLNLNINTGPLLPGPGMNVNVSVPSAGNVNVPHAGPTGPSLAPSLPVLSQPLPVLSRPLPQVRPSVSPVVSPVTNVLSNPVPQLPVVVPQPAIQGPAAGVNALIPQNAGTHSVGGVESHGVAPVFQGQLETGIPGVRKLPSASLPQPNQGPPTHEPRLSGSAAPLAPSNPGLRPPQIRASGTAVYRHRDPNSIELRSGQLLVSTKGNAAPLVVTTPGGHSVTIQKEADVLVTTDGDTVRVNNLTGMGKNVRVHVANTTSGRASHMAVEPGIEVVAKKQNVAPRDVRPADGVGRRNRVVANNGEFGTSEVNLPSLVKSSEVLRSLFGTRSAADKIVADNIVKTAAAIGMVKGFGGFDAVAGDAQTQQSAGGAARSLSGPVLSAGQQVAGAVTGAAQEVSESLPEPVKSVSGTVIGLAQNVLRRVPPLSSSGSGGNGGSGGGGGAGGTSNGQPLSGQGSVFVGAPEPQQSAVSSTGNSGTGAGGRRTESSRTFIPSNVRSNPGDITGRGPVGPGAFRKPNSGATEKMVRDLKPSRDPAEGRTNDTSRPVEEEPSRKPPGVNLIAQQPTISASNKTNGMAPGTVAGAAPGSAPPRQIAVVPPTRALSDDVSQLAKIDPRIEDSIRRNPAIAFFIGLLFASLFLLMLYLAYLARRRALAIEQQGRELNALTRELQLARDSAIEGSRLKSEFVANISHEIRTPMSAVLGTIGLLFDTNLDAKQRDLAVVLKDSARSLLEVINDILDFSKIEAGKLHIQNIDFSPALVVKEVTDLVRAAGEEKQLSIDSTVDVALPAVVHGDPLRLRQILLNLAGNAVKFTATGSVEIKAQMVDAPESASDVMWVKFSVLDTGIGISDEAKRRLFEPFVQADGSTTRQFGGTGLGLSISKRLAELMGGRIELNSIPGQGSDFSLFLPFAEARVDPQESEDLDVVQASPTAAPAVSGAQAGIDRTLAPDVHSQIDNSDGLPSGTTVLVAEDSPVLQRIVRAQLERLSFRVDIANNGMEAVEAARSGKYSLIFMDWQMPEMDGLDATRKIRESGWSHADIPIIAMTANAMEGDKKACLAAGMSDYISKPFTLEQLKSILQRWIPAPQDEV